MIEMVGATIKMNKAEVDMYEEDYERLSNAELIRIAKSDEGASQKAARRILNKRNVSWN